MAGTVAPVVSLSVVLAQMIVPKKETQKKLLSAGGGMGCYPQRSNLTCGVKYSEKLPTTIKNLGLKIAFMSKGKPILAEHGFDYINL